MALTAEAARAATGSRTLPWGRQALTHSLALPFRYNIAPTQSVPVIGIENEKKPSTTASMDRLLERPSGSEANAGRPQPAKLPSRPSQSVCHALEEDVATIIEMKRLTPAVPDGSGHPGAHPCASGGARP